MGELGSFAEACHEAVGTSPYHVFGTHAGYVLLPTGCERNVIHLALGHLTANTAVNAQERAKEIEDSCDKGFSFGCLDTLHGHCALEHGAIDSLPPSRNSPR